MGSFKKVTKNAVSEQRPALTLIFDFIIVIPVFIFYILLDKPKFLLNIHTLLNKHLRQK